MSKIVQAVNAMISNSEQISKVRKRKNEYFFLYMDNYKWSIFHLEDTDDYILKFYPSDISFEDLISKLDIEGDYFIEHVAYNSRDLGTKEAYHTFKEIHMIVMEKTFGVDKVLDDIISGEVPF
jgi:hypothetical protein